MKINQLLPSVREEVKKPFEEKLARAKQLVGMFANKNACVSCSFGKDSTVVLWLCLQENPNIPVVYSNTGVEFHETYLLRDKLKEEWHLNLIENKPVMSFWQLWKGYNRVPDGGKGSGHNKKRDRCCRILKEDPFKRTMKQYGFLYNFTGITACESRQRMLNACQRGQEYYLKRRGCWVIHPILYWTPEEVFQFCRDNDLPLNQAYEKYKIPRIGCVPYTCYLGWKKQLAHVNPKMYRVVQEQLFHQKLLETGVKL